MPNRELFEYAVVRVVPHVERGEFVNAGIILHCQARGFLAAQIELDEARLLAIAPDADLATIRSHLEAMVSICQGAPDAGDVARLPLRERFAWLTAPRSTAIQTSPAHAGLCDAPELALEKLLAAMVRPLR